MVQTKPVNWETPTPTPWRLTHWQASLETCLRHLFALTFSPPLWKRFYDPRNNTTVLVSSALSNSTLNLGMTAWSDSLPLMLSEDESSAIENFKELFVADPKNTVGAGSSVSWKIPWKHVVNTRMNAGWMVDDDVLYMTFLLHIIQTGSRHTPCTGQKTLSHNTSSGHLDYS